MQIKNPTKERIEVSIGTIGTAGSRNYVIEAEGTLDNVPEEHARYWQENLHKFLILKKDKEVSIESVPEIPSPKSPEAIVEIVEEEVIAPVEETVAEIIEEDISIQEEVIETPVVETPVVTKTTSKGGKKK